MVTIAYNGNLPVRFSQAGVLVLIAQTDGNEGIILRQDDDAEAWAQHAAGRPETGPRMSLDDYMARRFGTTRP